MAEANARYSAFEDERDTVCCLLVRHDMRDGPMKKQETEMDLLVSWQPAQSASEKPSNCRVELHGKNNPLPGEDLRYLRTLHAAV